MCATLLSGGGTASSLKKNDRRGSPSIYANEGYAYTLYNKNKYIDFLRKNREKMGNIITGVLGAATTLLGKKPDFEEKRREQERLSSDAARINYEWGEKAARNAYNRQMEMYERTLKDNSFAARRKQMEDAGLSVGLLYGQAGAQGGGAGSLEGGTQGQTGGAKAGDAAAIAGLALQQKQLDLQEIATIADANLKNAQAENLGAKTTTENKTRDQVIAGLRESARGQWIANNLEQFNQWVDKTILNGHNTNAKWSDDVLGEFEARSESLTTAAQLTPIIGQMVKTATAEQQQALMAAEEALTQGKTKWGAQQVLIDYMNMLVAKQNANTNEYNAATNRLEYSLKKLLSEYDIKMTNTQISQIVQAMELNERQVEFGTGGWAKASTIIHGLSSVGQFYVGGQMAKAAMLKATR